MARKQSSTKAKQIGQRRNSRRAPSKAKSREGLGASLRGQQQCLPFEAEEHVERRGGKRKGAGRKRQGPRDRVSHAKRPSFKPEWPLHVTLRLKEGLPTLRCEPNMEIFRQVMRECCELEGFRVTDWSVQSNHAHMIVEAESQEAPAPHWRSTPPRPRCPPLPRPSPSLGRPPFGAQRQGRPSEGDGRGKGGQRGPPLARSEPSEGARRESSVRELCERAPRQSSATATTATEDASLRAPAPTQNPQSLTSSSSRIPLLSSTRSRTRWISSKTWAAVPSPLFTK
jgi:hypothetical protein